MKPGQIAENLIRMNEVINDHFNQGYITGLNKSGALIKEGRMVQFDEMSKIRKFFIEFGMALPLIKEVNYKQDIGQNTIGFIKESCKKGDISHVVQCGLINNVDTSAFKVGQELYISKSKPGELTTNPNE